MGLKSNSKTSDSNPTRRSRTQQALKTIWKTVGGVVAEKAVSNNRATVKLLDLESPIPEADLREYEKIDSPRADSPSTSDTDTQLPIISPRFSPRDNSPCEPIRRQAARQIYTPPNRERRNSSRPRTPSPARPNYTEASCRASDQKYIESVVREARSLCEALLDTEEADEYVELHASVLNAKETATTLRLARTRLQQNWGAVFYVPSQLKVIGWSSKQYLVIDKLTPCSTDGGPSPAMIGGVQARDVVRPDQVEEITDEQFEDQQDQLMKEVLEQGRQNAVETLTRMTRMSSTQKRVFLDACV